MTFASQDMDPQAYTVDGDRIFNQAELIETNRNEPPCLVVVVDTEESFNWSAPFDRSCTDVGAMSAIGKGQEACDSFGVKPTYVVDYPVVSQAEGYQPLLDIFHRGNCLIGAHLHPWVNPPFEEEVTSYNAYPGNLPMSLEKKKLVQLTERIESVFKVRPIIYKAGRYGLGADTLETLFTLGYRIDLSPSPPFVFLQDGGPDYSQTTALPFKFFLSTGDRKQGVCIPTTGGYSGLLSNWGGRLYSGLSSDMGLSWRLPGIFSRLGLLERARLSPEGHTLSELKVLTKTLYDQGQRVFHYSYHSPTLAPGNTSYTSSHNQVDRFLSEMKNYFDYFLNDLNGVVATPVEIYRKAIWGHGGL